MPPPNQSSKCRERIAIGKKIKERLLVQCKSSGGKIDQYLEYLLDLDLARHRQPVQPSLSKFYKEEWLQGNCPVQLDIRDLLLSLGEIQGDAGK